jgi:hypothetical protein
MANRLLAPPNTEEEEEFLTDVDESPLAPREEDDTPTRRRCRIQEGLRGRRSEDEDTDEDVRRRRGQQSEDEDTDEVARKRQACVSTDGYDDETDRSDPAEDAKKGAATKRGWRMSLRRKEGFSAQKRREEKQRSDKYAQKGMAENRRVYVGENATANPSAYADENADENASENVSAYTAANVDENPNENASANPGANASAYAGAYAGAYTDDEVDVRTRSTDPEEPQVDTVRRRLYTGRGE